MMFWKRVIAAITIAAAFLLATGCAGIDSRGETAGTGETSETSVEWHGVLVAGAFRDRSLKIDNWDNAINGMLEILLDAGVSKENIRMHSSRPEYIGTQRSGITLQPAWKFRIESSIREFDLRRGDGLIVYLTSHGADDRGLVLESEEDFRNIYRPGELDELLDSLPDIPILVFVSACFSGDFISGEESIAGEQRMVLTASAEDRSSFGCGAGSYMPEWDNSLLKVLRETDPNAEWAELIRRLERHIAEKEEHFPEDRKSDPGHLLPSTSARHFQDLLRAIGES